MQLCTVFVFGYSIIWVLVYCLQEDQERE